MDPAGACGVPQQEAQTKAKAQTHWRPLRRTSSARLHCVRQPMLHAKQRGIVAIRHVAHREQPNLLSSRPHPRIPPSSLHTAGCTKRELLNALATVDGEWPPPSAVQTSEVRQHNFSPVLGAMTGPNADTTAEFQQRVASTGAIHTAIDDVCAPAIELALALLCANSSGMNCPLRMATYVLSWH